jgi:hypothetical protein
MRMMTEEERVSTLEELQKNKGEVWEILRSMPISMRTDALKKKKTELEQKLCDIDKAITMFSRKVVYIDEKNAK